MNLISQAIVQLEENYRFVFTLIVIAFTMFFVYEKVNRDYECEENMSRLERNY